MRRTTRAVVIATTSTVTKRTPAKKKKDSVDATATTIGESNKSKPKQPPQSQNRKRSSKGEVKKDQVSPYFASSTIPGAKLDRDFYHQATIPLAKELLGKVLCRKLPQTGQILRGTIVETEAYPGEGDAASHSYKGVPTEASMPMFMQPGTAYVYMTYGMYYCFNVSANDNGGACLFRAAEVDEDYEIMHTLRRPKRKKAEADSAEQNKKPPKRLKPEELANGPSKLCLAFNITRDSCNKLDLVTSDDLWLEVNPDEKYRNGDFEVDVSRRVGIDSTPPEARNQLYRFFIKDNPSVSKAKFKEENKSKKISSRSKNKRTIKK